MRRIRLEEFMTVQLLVFEGCPLAEPARNNLNEALAVCDINEFEEIDILDLASPEELRGWGSSTISVNGLDVSGPPKRDSASCRIYAADAGVPEVQTIVNELRNNELRRIS